ncbi:hypothetical protein PHYSODRAFT_297834 [Phytophthora sojae]|uniref:Uncharacterized protein n=1 Tax=Phytophthora sojae (strain P6497) TaxID=1094619 RepID=G4ZAI9_PHYSP|nr:hypothetical protein PHYSODRAFT_297834 [Phytophthora sojae]EGZ19186.1 hypothetical protein PHYSODRAFT_297834 [Phytophthora sojae]|eukprot:XP_009521903.1 hypothetical protein PHYSODRAFT_297834 [Phytophthora sojae]
MLRLHVSVKTLANRATTKTILCNGHRINVPVDRFGRFPQGTFNCEQLFRLAHKTPINHEQEDAEEETESDEGADDTSLTPVELRYAIPADCGCANIEFVDGDGEEEDCNESVAGSKYQVTYSDSSCIQGTFDPSAYLNCGAASDTYTTCSVTFEADSSDSSFPDDQDDFESESARTESTTEDEEEPSTRLLAQETAASSSAISPRFTTRSLLTLAIVAALALQ